MAPQHGRAEASELITELREARARIARYVTAIGEGVAVAEIREALATTKAQADAVELQLAEYGGGGAPPLDRAALEQRVADWRGILRRGPQMARQLLRKLLPGRLTLLPHGGGVTFRGVAACAGILSGLTYVRSVVPPAGNARRWNAPLPVTFHGSVTSGVSKVARHLLDSRAACEEGTA